MKKYLLFLLALLLCVRTGQVLGQDAELFAIASYPLEITYHKTVNLIFPYAIKSVDMGSKQVLARKAQGVDNILQTKAATEAFEPTNLTVITSDGKLYSFLVRYAHEPSQLNLEVIAAQSRTGSQALFSALPGEPFLENSALQAASHHKKWHHRIRQSRGKATLSLRGLYTRQDLVLCRLKIKNLSAVSYQTESIRFYLRDKKRVKRTATQQTQIDPLYSDPKGGTIGSGDSQELVLVLPKFTIPDKKELVIQLSEQNGSRHLTLHVPAKAVVKALVLD